MSDRRLCSTCLTPLGPPEYVTYRRHRSLRRLHEVNGLPTCPPSDRCPVAAPVHTLVDGSPCPDERHVNHVIHVIHVRETPPTVDPGENVNQKDSHDRGYLFDGSSGSHGSRPLFARETRVSDAVQLIHVHRGPALVDDYFNT